MFIVGSGIEIREKFLARIAEACCHRSARGLSLKIGTIFLGGRHLLIGSPDASPDEIFLTPFIVVSALLTAKVFFPQKNTGLQ